MATDNAQTIKSSFFQRYQLFLIFILAFILVEIPFISLPFKWLESYFHELSHGLAAILTGGRIISIELSADGSGLCTTQGGSRFVVSFMGYAGASLFGYWLVRISMLHHLITKLVVAILWLVIAVTLVFWVKDILTLFITLLLLALVTFKAFYSGKKYLPLALQFIGATVLLNSIKSPLYLFDGGALGDGATLANMTLIPEMIWVVIWCGIGMITLYLLVKKQTFQQR
ncbi:M50 family metallopeptidase [Thalassotalea sediminis]|uniref:M50 family metallopeptidase n=1 Tax=Thalassotalea sediminis TaxID=1759089 RepID=UPI002572611E|nr:M50 family metallopeptidase [Thalassotalea sediminis]